MRIFLHRVNRFSVADLDSELGVEFDVRNVDGELRVCHDYEQGAPALGEYLGLLRTRPGILNLKEMGLALGLLRDIKASTNANILFLDVPIPEQVEIIDQGLGKHLMVRLSNFELPPMDFLAKSGSNWLWVDFFEDSFDHLELAKEIVAKLNFKLCIASPELYGSKQRLSTTAVSGALLDRGISPDAVCTKTPKNWGYGR